MSGIRRADGVGLALIRSGIRAGHPPSAVGVLLVTSDAGLVREAWTGLGGGSGPRRGTCRAREVAGAVAALTPDVVLLDGALPPSCLEAFESLPGRFPRIPMLFVSTAGGS